MKSNMIHKSEEQHEEVNIFSKDREAYIQNLNINDYNQSLNIRDVKNNLTAAQTKNKLSLVEFINQVKKKKKSDDHESGK